jgi:hypothetical protein
MPQRPSPLGRRAKVPQRSHGPGTSSAVTVRRPRAGRARCFGRCLVVSQRLAIVAAVDLAEDACRWTGVEDLPTAAVTRTEADPGPGLPRLHLSPETHRIACRLPNGARPPYRHVQVFWKHRQTIRISSSRTLLEAARGLHLLRLGQRHAGRKDPRPGGRNHSVRSTTCRVERWF